MRYFCINIIEIIPQTFNIVVHEIRFALLLKTNIISFNFPLGILYIGTLSDLFVVNLGKERITKAL